MFYVGFDVGVLGWASRWHWFKCYVVVYVGLHIGCLCLCGCGGLCRVLLVLALVLMCCMLSLRSFSSVLCGCVSRVMFCNMLMCMLAFTLKFMLSCLLIVCVC